MPTPEVDAAVTRLAREETGRVTAILARRLEDLDLADDAVQEALVEAWTTWPDRGVPDNPAGWLMTVARRKALDLLRRRASADRRTRATAGDLTERAVRAAERGLLVESDLEVADDRLRLVLLCCHPALHPDAQVALTLRLVGGLTTHEIAAAYLVPEPAITQRIVRAKRKIRLAGMPLSLPDTPEDRLDVVLGVLYLVFNEGYLSHADDGVLRADLVDEAIRLARVVRTSAPEHPETTGLLALMLFQRARFAARLDRAGDLVRLEDQDRTRWDGAGIDEANAVLAEALAARRPGPYQLQAVIASLHANARTAADTDWALIATAYGQLVAVADSPVVRLNRAVAIGMADGAPAGLARLEEVVGLEAHHLLHAVRGDLLHRAGRYDEARASFATAAGLAVNPAERRLLERRASADPVDHRP